MKSVITAAVLTGILLLIPASPVLAASIINNSASASVSALNARDLVIQSVAAGASFQLHFSGAEHIDFGSPGELLIMRHGLREHYRPEAYQMIEGKMHRVVVSYSRVGSDRVNVNFIKYDPSAPIILRGGGATL